MLHKLTRLQAFPTFNDPNAAGLGTPHFERLQGKSIGTTFGQPRFEKTALGHFYSDTHKMAAPKRPMMDMCHTEDHDGFADHIISTHLGEFGEIEN